jgi:hypothetical protein
MVLREETTRRESDMHKVNGHDIPDLYDIFDESLDPFLAKWKVSKLIELLETLTVRQDKLLAALKALADVDPVFHGDDGTTCYYCHREWQYDYGINDYAGTHAPDCLWMRSKAAIAEIEAQMKEGE